MRSIRPKLGTKPRLTIGLLIVGPLCLTLLGLTLGREKIRLLRAASLLDDRIEEAKRLGMPFDATELRPVGVTNETNVLTTYKHVPWTYKQTCDLPLLLNFGLGKKLEQIRKQLGNPKVGIRTRAQFTRFDPGIEPHGRADIRSHLVWDFAQRGVDLMLTEAIELAKQSKFDGSLERLKLCVNILRQISDDPRIEVSSHHRLNLVVDFINGLPTLYFHFRSSPAHLNRLKLIHNSAPCDIDLVRELKWEFVQTLALVCLYDQVGWPDVNTMNGIDESPWDPPTEVPAIPRGLLSRGKLSVHIQASIRTWQELKNPGDFKEWGLRIGKIRADLYDDKDAKKFNLPYAPIRLAGQLQTHKAMALWAAEILLQYGMNVPDSLPAREDPGVGKRIRYVKKGSKFSLYSDGWDGIDQGGATNVPGERPKKYQDDLLVTYPREEAGYIYFW